MNNDAAYPQSFRTWRRYIQAVYVLFAFCLISLLPYVLIGLSNPPIDSGVKTLYQVHNSTLTLIGISFFLASMLGLGAVLHGFWKATRLPHKPDALYPISRAKYERPALLIIGLFICGIAGMALAGPSISALFRFYSYDTCNYHITVVAYEDRNGNGLRDLDEPGLAGVPITALHGTISAGQTQTDASGLAKFGTEYTCYTPTIPEANSQPASNQVSVSAQAPAGYTATTALTSDFFPAKWSSNPPVHVVYVGFQKKP